MSALNKDLTLETGHGRLNVRTCALVYKKNQVLLQKVNNEDWGEFYCLAGGRVSFGESSLEAIVREVDEELCVKVDPQNVQLAATMECFFRNNNLQKEYHEIAYFYRIPVPETFVVPTEERDGQAINLEWVSLDHLEDKIIYPLILKEKLIEMQKGVHHYINREN